MSANQFYVTLPSNTEANCTPANFHVNLPHRIKLEGDWEVGLAEIIYPNSWHNVSPRDNENIVQISYLQDGETELTNTNVPLPAGLYSNTDDLISILTTACQLFPLRDNTQLSEERPISFGFNTATNKVNVRIVADVVKMLRLHDKLAYLLGFDNGLIYKSMENISSVVIIDAPRVSGIRVGMDMLYVYCSLVENQVVGNVMAPLLRIVDVHGKYMQLSSRMYDNPHYVPLTLNDFASIEINIKNDLNEFVSFEFGSAIVKLHFRHCSAISSLF